MRTMTRNRQKFYYQNFVSKTPITDSSGYETGEESLTYTAKTEAYVNISGASTNAFRQWYGIDVNYDRTIVPEFGLNVTEESRLWIDNLTADEPDYIVVRISKTLNETILYVRKIA